MDVDPSPNIGKYLGASANVKVGNLYFELAGYIFTNSAAVFSFQSQNPTIAPADVSNFVEFGFYAPVFFGSGADLPTTDQNFSGLPEAAFNFQSIVNGITYYDVAVATNLSYALTPVPEAQGHLYAAFGLVTLAFAQLFKPQKS